MIIIICYVAIYITYLFVPNLIKLNLINKLKLVTYHTLSTTKLDIGRQKLPKNLDIFKFFYIEIKSYLNGRKV